MYTKLSSIILRRHIVKIAGDYFADPITQAQAHMADTTLRQDDWRGATEADLDKLNRDADLMNKGSGKAIQLLNESTGGKFAPLRIAAEGVDTIDDLREKYPQYDPENIYIANKRRLEELERLKSLNSLDNNTTIPIKGIKKLIANHVEHGATNPGALGLLGTGILGLAGHRKLTRGRVF